MTDLERIEAKLDRIAEDISDINVTTARNTLSLEHHIARTDALEARVEQVAAETEPLKAHVALWSGIGKLLTWTLGISGAVFTILKAFGTM